MLLNAPLKDPIKYKVMGYEISLRRQEAEMIEIVGEKEMCRESVQLDYHEGWSEDMRFGRRGTETYRFWGKRRTINVALVGNPNCGKTSLFNIASGSHEHVGNYSGVTVDAKDGVILTFRGIISASSTCLALIRFLPILPKRFMCAITSSTKLRISLLMWWTLPIWNGTCISPPS